MKWILGSLLLPALCAGTASTAFAKERVDVLTPLSASVLAPPAPVPTSDGRRHLVYELQLLNWTAAPVRLDRVEVRDGASDRLLAAYGPKAMEPLLVQAPFARPHARTLAPSESTILWFDVVLPARGAAPRSLVHRITMNGIVGPVGRTRVGARPVTIAPPLRGPLYVDGNGCCGDTPHVRAIQTIDGVRRLSQRYAIDFVQSDAHGRTYVGDARRSESYLIYGDPAHAVADGVVTSVLDGRRTQDPPVPDTTLDNYDAARFVTGNHVILRLSRNVYALYAHLQAGGIRVRRGQRVRQGDVLALTGNSGNTTAPHLHFQLMDGNSPLASDGVPYVFDRYTGEGRITTPYEQYGETGLGTIAPLVTPRRGVLPMTREVLTFG